MMTTTKVNLSITERRLPFQPTSGLSLNEQLVAAIKAKNAPHYSLDCDDDGNILIDKDAQPELYDWAVNG